MTEKRAEFRVYNTFDTENVRIEFDIDGRRWAVNEDTGERYPLPPDRPGDRYFEYTFPREDLVPGGHDGGYAPPMATVYVDRFPPPGRLRSIILASAIAGLCIGVALTIAAYSLGVLP